MKYRTIGSAATRVDISSVCLGALPFGAVIDEPTSFDILDRFVEAGGTFIDTANNYCCWKSGCTGDESEDTLGRWLASRGLRDRVVIASKAGARPDPALGDRWPGSVEGLSAETLRRAVQGSLGRLGLDRIDVYYAHVEDRRVPLGETVRAFGDLVAEGLVGIAGCSNHTTGRIRRARLIAEAEGLVGYSVVQQRYTYLQPSPVADFDLQEHMDAELLEYAAGQEDLTLLGYSTLLSGAYSRDDRDVPIEYQTASTAQQLASLRELAASLGATANQVVLAWMLQSDPPVVPILGVSSVAQLEACLAAIDLELGPDVMEQLDTLRSPAE